jgi:hypothetical protein
MASAARYDKRIRQGTKGTTHEAPPELTADCIRVPDVRMILRCLLVGVLVIGVVAGCGNQSGGGGDKPKPGSSSSQDGGGGGGY